MNVIAPAVEEETKDDAWLANDAYMVWRWQQVGISVIYAPHSSAISVPFPFFYTKKN